MHSIDWSTKFFPSNYVDECSQKLKNSFSTSPFENRSLVFALVYLHFGYNMFADEIKQVYHLMKSQHYHFKPLIS